MYSGVPAMTPVCVRLASSTARARPKSVILTRCDAVLQQDVGRLDVAVDQALGVGRRQPAGDLHADAQHLLAAAAAPSRSSLACSVGPAMYSMTR